MAALSKTNRIADEICVSFIKMNPKNASRDFQLAIGRTDNNDVRGKSSCAPRNWPSPLISPQTALTSAASGKSFSGANPDTPALFADYGEALGLYRIREPRYQRLPSTNHEVLSMDMSDALDASELPASAE